MRWVAEFDVGTGAVSVWENIGDACRPLLKTSPAPPLPPRTLLQQRDIAAGASEQTCGDPAHPGPAGRHPEVPGGERQAVPVLAADAGARAVGRDRRGELCPDAFGGAGAAVQPRGGDAEGVAHRRESWHTDIGTAGGVDVRPRHKVISSFLKEPGYRSSCTQRKSERGGHRAHQGVGHARGPWVSATQGIDIRVGSVVETRGTRADPVYSVPNLECASKL
eukprot:gene12565-biopygen8162